MGTQSENTGFFPKKKAWRYLFSGFQGLCTRVYGLGETLPPHKYTGPMQTEHGAQLQIHYSTLIFADRQPVIPQLRHANSCTVHSSLSITNVAKVSCRRTRFFSHWHCHLTGRTDLCALIIDSSHSGYVIARERVGGVVRTVGPVGKNKLQFDFCVFVSLSERLICSSCADCTEGASDRCCLPRYFWPRHAVGCALLGENRAAWARGEAAHTYSGHVLGRPGALSENAT